MSQEKKHSNKKQIKKTKEYEEKLAEYLSGWQRAQADYQNLKKESLAEKEKLAAVIKEDVLSQIFPIIDNFEIALAHVPSGIKKESWYEGFEHLYRQIDKVLTEFGVEKLDAVGKQFDENTMEAVQREIAKEFESGQVVRQLACGYLIQGKIVRPAKVIVAE